MIKNYVCCLLLVFGIFIAPHLHGQSCEYVLFADDFSNPSGWQSQGTGDVNVGNGICNFANVYSGSYNRVYQATTAIFPDTYWRADFDFSILNPNAYGGVGEVLLALTAGPLDFISYDLSQGYLETTQDGIAVILHSDNANDNDINHWYFIIEGKKGASRLFDVGNVIHANSAISDYYIRLERSSYGLTQLSICTDQNYTNHLPGSPVTYAIDPTITGLNHVQHGTSTPGTPTRNINATIDNDFICGDPFQPTAIDPLHGNNDGLLVFPNPGNTTVQVALEGMGTLDCAYTIYNMVGSSIVTEHLPESRQIDVTQLPAGNYLIMVTGLDQPHWAKFQKQ